MKNPTIPRNAREKDTNGFALVVSLTMLVLLTIIAVGLLSLSAITLRTTAHTSAQAEAQANARLALMIAIGELQREMGPDQRVSAESAIFDNTPDSPSIQGVAQSRWLASYNSWGNWLNAEYQLPDGGGSVRIADLYTPRRERMFRRWMLSLPVDMETDVNAPNSINGWNDDNSVVLVGEGTLGTKPPADQVTRAHLLPVDDNGNHAWWISPKTTAQGSTLAAARTGDLSTSWKPPTAIPASWRWGFWRDSQRSMGTAKLVATSSATRRWWWREWTSRRLAKVSLT